MSEVPRFRGVRLPGGRHVRIAGGIILAVLVINILAPLIVPVLAGYGLWKLYHRFFADRRVGFHGQGAGERRGELFSR